MKLVIGGYAQGKLNYVLENYMVEEGNVFDGELPELAEEEKGTAVIYHFHYWMRRRLACDGCPEEEILTFVERYPDCVIISDEIGNGIVPMEAFERTYRERTGRMLTELAKRAEGVERVICGIGQKLK